MRPLLGLRRWFWLPARTVQLVGWLEEDRGRVRAVHVDRLFAMMSLEICHNVKLPYGIDVGATLRKRKTNCQIENLSRETCSLLSPPPDTRLTEPKCAQID